MIVVDGDQPGSNATYVCNDGFAMNDGGTRIKVVSIDCKIELSPSPSLKWTLLENECERMYYKLCLY